MMYLVEEFLSIQGEGFFTGRLAYFIRFAGCNFNCKGFNVKKEKNGKVLIGCDTLRAVYVKEFQDEYYEFNLDILKNTINTLDKQAIIVITGGEPLLNQNNEEFLEFLEFLVSQNRIVQFETNASIILNNNPIFKKCYFALGIKLANSLVDSNKRINHLAIKSILNNSKLSFFKAVLSAKDIEDNNTQEVLELKNIYKDELFYLMPQGATNQELKDNAKNVLEYAIKNGFCYTDRIHIRIYDDKEGV